MDDKFTVVCYSRNAEVNVLPGFALDADPRFPFYKISKDIDRAAQGEGKRIDAYMQLKTCPSEKLKGKILIDSPGFDADSQRTSTLSITKHIIDLSDLVLVLFDARHPESGAMHDTLEHLVGRTLNRPDSSKFLYILNQIDTAAREDNPEEVFGAWQRAIAQKGLVAGRFFMIYNPQVAVAIEPQALRERFESKRDTDLAEIFRRIRQVEVERAYRIIGALDKTAEDIQDTTIPKLHDLLARWRGSVLKRDLIVYGATALVIFLILLAIGDFSLLTAPIAAGLGNPILGVIGVALILGVLGWIHYAHRGSMKRRTIAELKKDYEEGFERDGLVRGFTLSTSWWRSVFSSTPAGWGNWAVKRIAKVVRDADRYVQALNDQYTNPSGDGAVNPPVSRPEPPAAATQTRRAAGGR